MRRLKSLDARATDDIVQAVWMKHLPETIKAALVTQTNLTLDELGRVADSIHEIVGTPRIAQISNQTPGPSASAMQPSALEQRVEKLSQQIAALTNQYQHSNNRNFRSRSLSRNRSYANNNHNNLDNANNDDFRKLGWYHKRYGNKATKCGGRCEWSGLGSHDSARNSRQGR